MVEHIGLEPMTPTLPVYRLLSSARSGRETANVLSEITASVKVLYRHSN